MNEQNKKENIIQKIVDNAKNSPAVQTMDIIFGLVEKKGEKDGR